MIFFFYFYQYWVISILVPYTYDNALGIKFYFSISYFYLLSILIASWMVIIVLLLSNLLKVFYIFLSICLLI